MMSKKQKSQKAQSAKSSRSTSPSASLGSTATLMPSSLPSASPTGASYSQSFNPDYSNVIKDLKRIGTLAGIFFIVLIVLSFFLQ